MKSLTSLAVLVIFLGGCSEDNGAKVFSKRFVLYNDKDSVKLKIKLLRKSGSGYDTIWNKELYPHSKSDTFDYFSDKTYYLDVREWHLRTGQNSNPFIQVDLCLHDSSSMYYSPFFEGGLILFEDDPPTTIIYRKKFTCNWTICDKTEDCSAIEKSIRGLN